MENANSHLSLPAACNSWERFAIVCGIHPFAQEFVLTVQRQVQGRAFKGTEYINDPERKYWALRSIGTPSLLEEIMVVQRRMMLGAMHDPVASILTVAVTGIEEAVMRCTMVYRDQFWDWVTGQAEPTAAELSWIRLVQAASAASGMRIEITSIIACR